MNVPGGLGAALSTEGLLGAGSCVPFRSPGAGARGDRAVGFSWGVGLTSQARMVNGLLVGTENSRGGSAAGNEIQGNRVLDSLQSTQAVGSTTKGNFK